MKKDKRFNRRSCIASIILLCMLYNTVIAQPALSITATKNTIRTGEPDTIQLKADWPGHPLQKGFSVPDSFPHFEIWDKGSVIANENGFTQNVVITSYDSGRFSVPPFELAEMKNSKTDSFAINVQPVNVDSLQDYHDIKDIIEVPPVSQWPFVVLIAGLTLVSVVALYFLLRKAALGKEAATSRKAKAGAFQRAMEALQKLEAQVKQPGIAKPFYTSLTGIYRTYLQEAYRYRSLQQTGGELILQAKPLLSEADFYGLANTIRLSDAVKFAKFEPAQQDWTTSLAAIRQSIEALEKRMTAGNDATGNLQVQQPTGNKQKTNT
jgi:hypothetical protein